MKKMKKSTFIIMTLILASVGLAAWWISAETSYIGAVVSTSDSPIEFTADFSNFELDTTNAAYEFETNATLQNDNGDITVLVDFTVTKTDVDTDSCDDYENDCTQRMFYNNTEVFVNDTVDLINGPSLWTSELSCVKLSCPQEVQVNLVLTSS